MKADDCWSFVHLRPHRDESHPDNVEVETDVTDTNPHRPTLLEPPSPDARLLGSGSAMPVAWASVRE
jgi:hypothetical protein